MQCICSHGCCCGDRAKPTSGFGPIAEVAIITRQSRVLRAFLAQADRRTQWLREMARSTRHTRDGVPLLEQHREGALSQRDFESRMHASFPRLKKAHEVHEASAARTAAAAGQDDARIIAAFVTFERWEDCQRCMEEYAGSRLCVDRSLRMDGARLRVQVRPSSPPAICPNDLAHSGIGQ